MIVPRAQIENLFFFDNSYFYDIKTTDPIDMHEVDHFKIDDLKQKIWNEIQNK